MLDRISPEDEHQAIGKLAVIFQLASEEQIRDALVIQEQKIGRGRHVLLGEILLERGVVTQEQLDLLLLIQTFLKTRSLDRRFAKMVPLWGPEHALEVDSALRKQYRLFKETKTIHSLAHILVGKDIPSKDQREQLGHSFLEALLFRFMFEKLMSTLLTDFVNAAGDEIDGSVDRALQRLAEFADADRAYVFLLSEDAKWMINSHEWCSPRVEPRRSHRQELSVDAFPSWMEKLKRFERVHLPSMNGSSGWTAVETWFLLERGVQSLVVEPIIWSDSLMGCVGLESVRQPISWSEDVLTILEVAAGIFAVALGRRQMQTALKGSEASLRHIYENAPMMMHSLDENGIIRDVNRKWLEETGFGRESVIGRQGDFLLRDEVARGEFRERLKELWSTGYIRDVPSQYVRKDGSVIDVLLNGATAEDPSGRKTSIFIVRDVTESNRMERAMARRLEYEKTIADISSHFVGVRNIDEAINMALADLKRYLGATVVFLYFPQGDGDGEKIYRIHDLFADRIRVRGEKLMDLSRLAPMLSRPSFQRGEALIVSDADGVVSDDSVRDFMAMRGIRSLLLQPVIMHREVRGLLGTMALDRPHRWEPGEVELLGISSVLIANAVNLKQAEEETRRAYQELNSIYRSSLGGLRVVDNDFNVVQINDSLAKMIGIPREEAIGAKCFETLPGPHCHTDRCTLARIRRGEVIKGEEEIRGGRGERELIVLRSAAPFHDLEGRCLGMVEDFHDITDRRRFESVAEAVESMNNIGYIFSGIRHEIGNPINSMKMALNVLKNNFDSFPREKILKYIDRTAGEISKMESLLKSLKSFSMFETPFIRIVNLETFMDDLLHLVKEDFARRDIEVSAPITPEAELVRVDPRALQQVLLNVLTNASDALSGRPSPRITVGAHRIADLVYLVVRDNGRGMTQTEKENLFKPFCTSKPQGTGLGLVIAKKMLAAMECGIEIHSEEGIGTSVTISIPSGRS